MKVYTGHDEVEDLGEIPAFESVKFLTELEASLGNVLNNYHRLAREAAEGREWQRKYMELLNQNLEHNSNMTAGLLGVALKMGELQAENAELRAPQG